MKVETEEQLLNRGLGWGSTALAIAIGIAAILVLYRDTALSMLATWQSSDTYAHGYVVVPLVLFLVWRRRRDLANLAPRPDYVGFLLLAGLGFAWLLAEAGQVQVVQQYAMTAMLGAAVLALAGRRVTRALAFPLMFLLLAVPFGEAFLPRLMDWTAEFTVGALRLSGIPVYREGNFFAIPSGQWSVVEACSGLRYLIASVTVGALYAYLTYRRFWRRALFMMAAIAVPILANFVRAYMIVMIGHLSSMKLAVGVDHFIYGWVFFGVVIGLLFWLGSFWREAPAPLPSRTAFVPVTRASPALMASALFGVTLLGAAWPAYARYIDRVDQTSATLVVPAGEAGWELEPQPFTQWQPHYGGAAATALALYRKGDRAVVLYLGHYRNQRQGAELVSSQNSVAGGKDTRWASQGEAFRTAAALEVRETRLGAGAARLLVWDWYRVAGRDTSNPYLAKALLARDKLLGRGDASTAIVLAAPYEARPEAAVETLRLFLREMRPAIEAAL